MVMPFFNKHPLFRPRAITTEVDQAVKSWATRWNEFAWRVSVEGGTIGLREGTQGRAFTIDLEQLMKDVKHEATLKYPHQADSSNTSSDLLDSLMFSPDSYWERLIDEQMTLLATALKSRPAMMEALKARYETEFDVELEHDMFDSAREQSGWEAHDSPILVINDDWAIPINAFSHQFWIGDEHYHDVHIKTVEADIAGKTGVREYPSAMWSHWLIALNGSGRSRHHEIHRIQCNRFSVIGCVAEPIRRGNTPLFREKEDDDAHRATRTFSKSRWLSDCYENYIVAGAIHQVLMGDHDDTPQNPTAFIPSYRDKRKPAVVDLCGNGLYPHYHDEIRCRACNRRHLIKAPAFNTVGETDCDSCGTKIMFPHLIAPNDDKGGNETEDVQEVV
jgi:hypothetical protein